MAGYIDHSISNNGMNAYKRGLFPISKLYKDDLIQANLNITVKFAKWLAKQGYWHPSEWHHCSKHYNEVNFYDIDDLVGLLEDSQKLKELQFKYDEYITESNKPETSRKVTGEYSVWEGSKRYGRMCVYKFKGVKIGNWIYIDDGGKKKADGNWITWRYVK